MPRNPEMTAIGVTRRDRDRLNALAAALTEQGPGRFSQPETVRYLLDCYDSWTGEGLALVQLEDAT